MNFLRFCFADVLLMSLYCPCFTGAAFLCTAAWFGFMHSDAFEVASSSDASSFHSRLAAFYKSGRLYEFACRFFKRAVCSGRPLGLHVGV